jgi:UDP-glucuronate decarboxylase
VDDLIKGLIGLMNTSDEVTGPINLGDPGELTILGLAEKVVELTNSRSEILFEPLPEDDPRQRQPDITLARQILGWEPRVPLEKGLKRTIEYFRSVLYPL